jgi:hypothetical protein
VLTTLMPATFSPCGQQAYSGDNATRRFQIAATRRTVGHWFKVICRLHRRSARSTGSRGQSKNPFCNNDRSVYL